MSRSHTAALGVALLALALQCGWALADNYDEKQLIEVPMLVGHYHMVAFALNSLGVEREPGVPGLPNGRA